MTRQGSIKKLNYLFNDKDVIVFAGKNVCEEAYSCDEENYFYIDSFEIISISFVLGVASACNKRVFLVCDEVTLLKNINHVLQLSFVGKSNVFIICLNNIENTKVFSVVRHKQVLFFEMGFKSYVLDPYIETTKDVKKFEIFLSKLVGPAIILLNVYNKKATPKILDKEKSYFVNRINKHIVMNSKE